MFLTPNNLKVTSVREKQRVHLIGVNGIGMIGAKTWLQASGFTVTGTDLAEEQEAATPIWADLLVVSSAIPASHPQYQWAISNDIPVIHRSECIRQLMPNSVTISVCGAHGKTTTSGLLAHLLSKFTNSCSFMIGGFVTSLGSSSRLDKDTRYCVLETDESDGSMLNMIGRYSLITNLDNEHLDYYGSFQNYLRTMQTFAASSEKCIIHNSCKEYGFEGDNLIWYGSDKTDRVLLDHHLSISEFTCHGAWGSIKIQTQLLGEHMAQNILGCLTLLYELSKTDTQIKLTSMDLNVGLGTFTGIKKRGERIHHAGITFINDYAHHPTEIAAMIKGYREVYPGQIKVIWEPHKYSRLRLNGLNSFKASFAQSNEVVVLPIYAASEAKDPNFTQESLANFIGGTPIQANQILEYLKSATPGDLVICMGAGHSYQIFTDAVEKFKLISSNQ